MQVVTTEGRTRHGPLCDCKQSKECVGSFDAAAFLEKKIGAGRPHAVSVSVSASSSGSMPASSPPYARCRDRRRGGQRRHEVGIGRRRSLRASALRHLFFLRRLPSSCKPPSPLSDLPWGPDIVVKRSHASRSRCRRGTQILCSCLLQCRHKRHRVGRQATRPVPNSAREVDAAAGAEVAGRAALAGGARAGRSPPARPWRSLLAIRTAGAKIA